MKYSFYELQLVCDWYYEVTADIGMHADLVRYWIGVAALLASPITPHFAEHIWRRILQHPMTIQHALWPMSVWPAVDTPTIEAGAYMHMLVKNVCDTELMLLKKLRKAKGRPLPFNPKKPHAFAIQPCSTPTRCSALFTPPQQLQKAQNLQEPQALPFHLPPSHARAHALSDTMLPILTIPYHWDIPPKVWTWCGDQRMCRAVTC